MENNIKEPIHIEFYGLPGCGKSTISHILANQFRDKGYEVYEPSYESDHTQNHLIRKVKKLIQTIGFEVFNITEYRNLKKIVILNDYKGIRGILGQMVNIVPKRLVYNRSMPGIYFWDEGLVQSSISLAFNSNIDVNKTKNILMPHNKKTILVNIDIDIRTTLERMKGRSTNDSRVEKEKNVEKKYEMMIKYYKSVSAISNDISICNSLNVMDEDQYISDMRKIESIILKK